MALVRMAQLNGGILRALPTMAVLHLRQRFIPTHTGARASEGVLDPSAAIIAALATGSVVLIAWIACSMAIYDEPAWKLPRMMAAMLVMPVMTLALDLAGLLGMATVMRGFGFPLVTISRQVQNWVSAGDLYGGLFKAVCFGLAVAAIGCRAGLGTGVGPRAVGLSATAAVVGGIVATIALDGVFALIFYRLHL